MANAAQAAISASIGKASGHNETVADFELQLEDMATEDDLEHTLNPFYIMDRGVFMQAQNITVFFTKLLLGIAELGAQGFCWSYVPVDPTAAAVGGLGAARGASF